MSAEQVGAGREVPISVKKSSFGAGTVDSAIDLVNAGETVSVSSVGMEAGGVSVTASGGSSVAVRSFVFVQALVMSSANIIRWVIFMVSPWNMIRSIEQDLHRHLTLAYNLASSEEL